MVQFKSIILITFIGLVVLFSGCAGKQAGTPAPTPAATAVPTVTAVPTATAAPTATTPTPLATTPGGLLSGTLYVDARMIKPAVWGISTYKLNSLQVQVTNEINSPILIKAQIVNDGQILEENSFTLQSVGNSYTFVNQKSHIINSTNVTLRLTVEGYQPAEYNFKLVDNI